MTPVLRAYLLAMAAPVVVLTAMLLVGPSAAPGDPVLLVVLLLLGAVASNFPVIVSPRLKTDAAPAVYLAAVLLFTPVTAVALIGGSRLLGEGVLCFRRNPATGFHRRQPVDLVFNTSRFMTAGALSALAYGAAGASLAGAVVATAVMYAVSTGLDVIAAGMHNRRHPWEIWAEIVAAVESMADVVDRRDPYTFQHSQSVADHAVRTARRLQLPDKEVELIRLAARVHDLGKIEVPDEVLHKQGRLTEAEFELMKKHPATGAEILAKFPEYKRGRELVLAHHERMDGLGYPRGLAGAAIAFGARVIAVADSWDAMTSDRPYRKALDAEVALAELLRGRGTQWDPQVVDAFAATLPGAVPADARTRWTEVRPLLRSLGAAVGVIG